MPFKYLDHTGESWIVASGQSLEEAFGEGAKALFNLMVPLAQIEPRESRPVTCSAESLDRLFFEWLNELIFIKDVEGLIFCKFELSPITRVEMGYTLEARVHGELFDPDIHDGHVDVKAATYSELTCEQTSEGYEGGWVHDI